MRWLRSLDLDKVDAKRGVHLLRVLVLGPPKVGKTTACVMTAPGPVGVLTNDDDSCMRHCKRLSIARGLVDADGIPNHYLVRRLLGLRFGAVVNELSFAKEEAAAGRINTLVFDGLSDWSTEEGLRCTAETLTAMRKEDGRKAWPLYDRRVFKLIKLLREMPCHVIITSHHVDKQTQSDDDKKAGVATTSDEQIIIPLLGTKNTRARVPGMVSDILYMGYDTNTEKRYFLTGPRGAITGPGSRSLGTTKELPANVKTLIRLFNAGIEGPTAPAKAKAKAEPKPAKPESTP